MARILVVDDSATMRKIVIKSVKQAGFEDCEFLEAADGVAALETLSKEKADLILLDINMPKMDGIQLVQAVRDQLHSETTSVGDIYLGKRVPNAIPIVMVTTEGSLEKAQEAIGAGANDYLTKPFTPEQLAEKIRPFLS